MDADEKIPLIIWLHGAGEGGDRNRRLQSEIKL